MICQLFDQSVVLTSVLIVKRVLFTLKSFLSVIVSVNFISNDFKNEREEDDMQQRPAGFHIQTLRRGHSLCTPGTYYQLRTQPLYAGCTHTTD